MGIGTAVPTANLDAAGTFKLGGNGTVQKNIINFSATLVSTVLTVGNGNGAVPAIAYILFDIPGTASSHPTSTRTTVVVSPAFSFPNFGIISSTRLISTTQVEVKFINQERGTAIDIGGTYCFTISKF